LQATGQGRVIVPGRGGEGVALPIVMQSADPSADAFDWSGESLQGPTPFLLHEIFADLTRQRQASFAHTKRRDPNGVLVL